MVSFLQSFHALATHRPIFWGIWASLCLSSDTFNSYLTVTCEEPALLSQTAPAPKDHAQGAGEPQIGFLTLGGTSFLRRREEEAVISSLLLRQESFGFQSGIQPQLSGGTPFLISFCTNLDLLLRISRACLGGFYA